MTGATGQDGYFLTQRLLDEGWTVYAAVRDTAAAEQLFGGHDRLRVVRRDLADPGPLASLIGDLRPDEMYNLAGESSVADSFVDPRATWETNAYVIVHLLDAIRKDSPDTRFYQASSGEMFGFLSGGEVIHDETSPLNPQSPYAAAKAAAHLLCRSYRESYGLRIACGHPVQPRVEASRVAVSQSEGDRPCRDPPPRCHGTSAGRQPQGTAGLGVCSRLCGGDGQGPSSSIASPGS